MLEWFRRKESHVPEERLKVAVTIATRGREEGCRRLVERVLEQEVPDDWELRVVVVDNDPLGSDLRLPDDHRLEVLHEPEPGIPFARNRGVERVLPWADIICFIDDDETPENGWLQALVGALESTAADIVSGPVRPRFVQDVPTWLALHPVFQRPEHADGECLATTRTGNTAVRSSIFERGLRFDPVFRESGGSDTHLFAQASASGSRIRWASTAVVHEWVPPERATVRWVLARSLRIGGNRVQFLRHGGAPALTWLRLVVGSGGEILLGVVSPLTVLFSRRSALWLLGRSARGIGAYLALLGVSPRPYG